MASDVEAYEYHCIIANMNSGILSNLSPKWQRVALVTFLKMVSKDASNLFKMEDIVTV